MVSLVISVPLLEQMFVKNDAGTWYRIKKGLPSGLRLISAKPVDGRPELELLFDDGKPGATTKGDVWYESLYEEQQ
jgi:hypothetical protein